MDKDRNGQEVPKVSAAEKISSTTSLEAKIRRAQEFAAKANVEGTTKERAFEGASDEAIIAALIHIGYTEEEAKASVAACSMDLRRRPRRTK